MIKSEAMNQFGYSSQDTFDTMLLDLGIDPDKKDFTESECARIRQHIASMGAKKALPTGEPDNAATNGHLTVTDDEILGVAESTGVDLDIVMSAAMHVENLERLKSLDVGKSDHNYIVYKFLFSDLKQAISANAQGDVLDIGCGNKPYLPFLRAK